MSHCSTCTCGTVEYGVTFIGGVRDGETYGPLTVEQICHWNRHYWHTARLVIRVVPETEWRRATDEEVNAWNGMMAVTR